MKVKWMWGSIDKHGNWHHNTILLATREQQYKANVKLGLLPQGDSIMNYRPDTSMNAVATSILKSYLVDHEEDIAEDINDFGELAPVFYSLFNRFPTKKEITMNFSDALEMLKAGQKVCRFGWNGKGMFLFYNPGSEVKITEGRPLAASFPIGTECKMLPYIMMKTADAGLNFVPWLASQSDLLSEDWMVVG